jgi:hypothetical protein
MDIRWNRVNGHIPTKSPADELQSSSLGPQCAALSKPPCPINPIALFTTAWNWDLDRKRKLGDLVKPNFSLDEVALTSPFGTDGICQVGLGLPFKE